MFWDGLGPQIEQLEVPITCLLPSSQKQGLFTVAYGAPVYAWPMSDVVSNSALALSWGGVVAVCAALAVVVVVMACVWWYRRRPLLQASAKFFARNFLRPGYVEITIIHAGKQAQQLGSVMLADAQGNVVDRTPQRDHRGRVIKTFSPAQPSVVLRVGYGGEATRQLLPTHLCDGVEQPLTTGWCTSTAQPERRIAVEGLDDALAKLHEDKVQHDVVEARRNGEGQAGVGGTASSRRNAAASRAAAGGAKRRRSQKRKCKK